MSGINFPQSGGASFPSVPDSLEQSDPELYEYLNRQQLVLQQLLGGIVSNDTLIQKAINKGTSGSFVIASGGHILITSGIVTAVSTT